MKAQFTYGSVVWARVATNWWPGIVTTSDKCPIEYIQNLKREPILIVKFFNEQEFFDVHRQDSVISYTSTRREDLIKKGINSLQKNETLLLKFTEDVQMAEKLTGGNPEILLKLMKSDKKKMDYTKLGFGTVKSKKLDPYESIQKEGFSNIGEAIQYKKGTFSQPAKIHYNSKILEQRKVLVDMKSDSIWFKCYECGYTCSRLNVIIWHNKHHLGVVEDYDSGIKIPGKRKRKQSTPQSRNQKNKREKKKENEHIHTNGHASGEVNGYKAEELLLDWQDDDDEVEDNNCASPNLVSVEAKLNGYKSSSEADEKIATSSEQPVSIQRDMNSAFDALLAETATNLTSTSSQPSNYVVNNDSDSDCSDWEKYYSKPSDSILPNNEEKQISNGNDCQINNTKNLNGTCEKFLDTAHKEVPSVENNNVQISNCSVSNTLIPEVFDLCNNDEINYSTKPIQDDQVIECSTDSESILKGDILPDDAGTFPKNAIKETLKCNFPKSSTTEQFMSTEENDVYHNKFQSGSREKQEQQKGQQTIGHPSIEEVVGNLKLSTAKELKANSSTAYMLVAVDAQGNNVPMPVLTEGGKNLMAVEASMEDGSTRTLYIDPAHLGPNVDLNNLMLHIDNSGQETVIIPSSVDQEEIEVNKKIDDL